MLDASTQNLDPLIEHAGIIITVGPGGVGKTTIAAAIAVEAAKKGRRVALCTIDPARRLIDALGLSDYEHTHRPQAIAPEILAELDIQADKLHVMMLDEKTALDAIVEKYADNEKHKQEMMSHPWYKSITDRLAGMREYLALDLLAQLGADDSFDLLVLDTPPSPNTLDFFAAPNKVLSFFEGDISNKLLVPLAAQGKKVQRAKLLGGKLIVKVLGSFTGVETLNAIASFMVLLRGIVSALAKSVYRVEGYMKSDDTAILLLTAPWKETLEEARRFKQHIEKHDMKIRAMIVNRILLSPFKVTRKINSVKQLDQRLEEAKVDEEMRDFIARCAHNQTEQAQLHEHNVAHFVKKMQAEELPLFCIPKKNRPPHSLAQLNILTELMNGKELLSH